MAMVRLTKGAPSTKGNGRGMASKRRLFALRSDIANPRGEHRLARFSGERIDHPDLFGGGFESARVGHRFPVTAYGYPAVIEDFESIETPSRWCVLTVSLPNTIPHLVVDHRTAEGRPHVPGGAFTKETGDVEFDLDFITSVDDPDVLARLLPVDLRTALLQRPVQRMEFAGARLLLRTFDALEANADEVQWLCNLATEVLCVTPAFLSPIDPDKAGIPFPRGLYGD